MTLKPPRSYKPWTRKEEAWLRANYPSKGTQYCVEGLNRPHDSIRCHVRKLKLSRDLPWSEEEKLQLRQRYQKDGPAILAAELNRPKGAVMAMAGRLGARKPFQNVREFAKSLYDQGWCDIHVGKAVGRHRNWYCLQRQAEGLPANGRKRCPRCQEKRSRKPKEEPMPYTEAPLPRAKERTIRPMDGRVDLSHDEQEFGAAMERYMRENRRPYPTYAEALAVAKSLGWRK